MNNAKFKVGDKVFFFNTSGIQPKLILSRIEDMNYWEWSDFYGYYVSYDGRVRKLMQEQWLYKTKEEALKSITVVSVI